MSKLFDIGYKSGENIKLANKILRVSRINSTDIVLYFFNKELQWNKITIKKGDPIPSYLEPKYALRIIPYRPDILEDRIDNNHFYEALLLLKLGDSVKQLYKYYKSRCQYSNYSEWKSAISIGLFRDKTITDKILNKQEVSESLRNLILKINNPIVEREFDNCNKNTFDFVTIYMSISSTMENRKEIIKDNLKEINKIALTKIKKSKCLEKYGVPINFLRLTRYVITRQSELMLQYELKEIKVD